FKKGRMEDWVDVREGARKFKVVGKGTMVFKDLEWTKATIVKFVCRACSLDVAAEKPYHVTSVSKFSTKFTLDDVNAIRKFGSGWVGHAVCDADFKVRVVA
ncbi:hypothetical protein H0H87_012751, partial [Tephrocybe sp. NHM501043]